eukprot:GILK01010681.1.p1 GENE.GILK01010681.1~~GILK01010681.1.p1  ORF type:complete len:302 (-),score=10.51 GILK01010681.1:2-874(-)
MAKSVLLQCAFKLAQRSCRGFVSSSRLSRSSGSIFSLPHNESQDPERPVDILDFRDRTKPLGGKVLITCEHASDRLPKPYRWSEKDKRLIGTHWSCDLGAKEFAQELAEAVGSMAVLSRFSRLLIDPNRPLASNTLMRDVADGQIVELNEEVTSADHDWRIWRYYLPYHLALGQAAKETDPSLILAIHSYTSNYEGDIRDFELGVLCTTQDALAKDIATAYKESRFNVRINEPWSGKEGFMYAADSLAVAGGPGQRKAVMLELRNDKAQDPVWRKRAIEVLLRIISERMR